MNRKGKCSYANVNGLTIYYEVHGAGGTPLVLLHGGSSTIDTSFGKLLPGLAKSRQIIAVEQQGHGHTPDADRPLSFEQMADDTAALLRQLKIGSADVFGYSDGGNVALGLAIRHPRLVRKLVVAGTNYNKDGYYPEVLEFRKNATPEDVPMELREAYTRVAPNPDHWSEIAAKVAKMGVEWDGWRSDEIQSIKAPTLVMVGDADFIRPEHAVEMYRLLPHARLAVLPGADHGLLDRRADWVVSMVESFLDAPIQTDK